MSDCIFCKIISGEIPSNKVYEDDKVFAFKDINPEAPIHVLIIPKTHITSINDLNHQNSHLISHIFLTIQNIVKELGIDESGYRVVANTGKDGGQTVNHMHFHLLAGRNLNWPPG
ncbi:MAG: histidine triad nucleotide-binding protein [Clostridium argentinense]|uniref:Histidine triad nucleotide-binding protein n=1 Tax=Clostridium faecium TaxID=2762223 RepID=A0ABR8YXH4_9CLOT|nr:MULTISPECIES: histidine triad nucleotide-binding protein [Clostridium]MBD8048822.1 histidine triad nucleotide-binding protein [Clostridium faecium]MBS5823946.1 histidine triad nucleotide-binding protein [Clostridium argentinense]MDU1348333.1 histidine triad nucleotide-binding protein [Clostridium argentinense]